MDINGYAPAVIQNGYTSVFMECHFYPGTKACQGLVYAVINHLINKVMEALYTGISNVHGRSFPDGGKP